MHSFVLRKLAPSSAFSSYILGYVKVHLFLPSLRTQGENMGRRRYIEDTRRKQAFVFKEHPIISDPFPVPCSNYWFCMYKLFL